MNQKLISYCLCIPEREEEWRRLQKQCEENNIEFNSYIPNDDIEWAYKVSKNFKYGFNAYSGRDSRWRHALAFRSHQEIITIAKNKNLNYFLMLEDDAYITNRYKEIFPKIELEIQNLDFDILYLGWWIGQETDEWNESIEQLWNNYKQCGIMPVNVSAGLHGVIIKSSAYDVLLNMECINCMDAQIGKSYLRCFAVFPKIIHVKNIKSQMEGCILKRKVL